MTPAEVEATLRTSSDNAARPDCLSLADVKQINLKELTALLNIRLITGHVPMRLHKAETILIPKSPKADKPGDFRHITVASRLVRVYHKIHSRRIVSNISINPRQKAFMPTDGCCENLFVLDVLLRDSRRILKPLCMVFVDISKVFDKASHDTIIRAMRLNTAVVGGCSWSVRGKIAKSLLEIKLGERQFSRCQASGNSSNVANFKDSRP